MLAGLCRHRINTQGNNGDVASEKVSQRNRGDHNDPRCGTNCYLKRIRYGNRVPLLDGTGQRPRILTETQIQNAGRLFDVVFDYGEHDVNAPKPDEAGQWAYRDDPFSLPRRLRGPHHSPFSASLDVSSLRQGGIVKLTARTSKDGG